MPSPFQHVKSKLLNELWLPLAQRGGAQLFPARKKHKKMRLFTLTDIEHQEIKAFEENKLTKREDVVAWTYSQQQAYRLETELGRSKVICEGRLDDVINVDGHMVSESFPCEMLNLDFLSQSPSRNSNGRVEKELRGGQILVGLLKKFEQKGFILFYTTILDESNLTVTNLSFLASLPLGMPNPADDINKKVDFVKEIYSSILQNNNYSLVEATHVILDVDNSTDKIFSLGVLAVRNN
jgi:hypothetical protein